MSSWLNELPGRQLQRLDAAITTVAGNEVHPAHPGALRPRALGKSRSTDRTWVCVGLPTMAALPTSFDHATQIAAVGWSREVCRTIHQDSPGMPKRTPQSCRTDAQLLRIEERFRKRRLGKVWRYSDRTLKETLIQAVEEIGHVPQVAEFDWWRQRQLELASARGDELYLPSATPYRRRWRTWAGALRHFGYSEAEIQGRLEPR